jgi:hypothetical protein
LFYKIYYNNEYNKIKNYVTKNVKLKIDRW